MVNKMPNKIKWLGKEFGKWLVDKVMIRKHLPGFVNCEHYKAILGNFCIHEKYLIEYPNSWENLDENKVEKDVNNI